MRSTTVAKNINGITIYNYKHRQSRYCRLDLGVTNLFKSEFSKQKTLFHVELADWSIWPFHAVT